MGRDLEIVRCRAAALRAEAEAAGLPADVLGRLLVQQAVRIWQEARDWQDIARELQFIAEPLDPDTDHEFMRP